jgi:hypothetical protein
MSRLVRTAGLAAALFAGTAASLVTAAPAQAAPQDCLQYLVDHHDPMNQQVVTACAFGAVLANATCVGSMTDNGVPKVDAVEACEEAGQPSQSQ